MTNSSYVKHLENIVGDSKKKNRFNIPFVVYLFIIAASCIPAIIIRYIQLRDGTNLKTGYYNLNHPCVQKVEFIKIKGIV